MKPRSTDKTRRRTTQKRVKAARATRSTPRRSGKRPKAATYVGPAGIEIQEIESLRSELKRVARGAPPRWNANPDDVRRSVAKLVLTLVEFIRQLLERQAIRRMDAGTLTPEQTEAVGLALMRLEETIRDIGAQFGLTPEELNLNLGPVGRLI
jgi:hypothetical protein